MKSFACLFAIVIVGAFPPRADAFGPKGHTLVGAIADKLLEGKPQAQKVANLLKKHTLADAARIADDIKHWDGTVHDNLLWTRDDDLRGDMKDFLDANSNSHGGHGHNPDHHSFHYTDISVNSNPLQYSPQSMGAGPTDVVHMINFCVGVLQGTITQPNRFKITPRVAVILLAHYVGDIHQPLHVGAAYFDAQGRLVDPAKSTARADHGGNDIQLHLSTLNAAGIALHAFWDDNTVDEAIRQIVATQGGGSTGSIGDVAVQLAKVAPQGGPLDRNVPVDKLSMAWANEILPMALDAHTRLTITPLPMPIKAGSYTFSWTAAAPHGADDYTVWAGGVIRNSVHRAGWRLDKLLETLLK